jgi:hypothetical protein
MILGVRRLRPIPTNVASLLLGRDYWIPAFAGMTPGL